jgi:hypothetical protein
MKSLMKLLCFIILASVLSIGQGCRKCYDCEVRDTATDVLLESESFCGKKNKKNYEERGNDETLDTYTTCVQQ